MVLPPVLWVFVIAMSPFVESRLAIPAGLYLGLDLQTAALAALAGNLAPVLPLLLFLEPVTRWLRRVKLFDRILERLFRWTREKKNIQKAGTMGLIATALIPAPFTGAWTGCLITFVFGVRWKVAIPTIVLGVLQEVVVVSLLSLGVLKAFGL
ncbi:MAG: small multi-drug export protein [Euryarchaeota archaeon]|nr:small multi-drug export protein [Euryarchaeota archaeon]